MAVEQGTRTETVTRSSIRRGDRKPNDQKTVPAVKGKDAGATHKNTRPAGPPTRVGRGF